MLANHWSLQEWQWALLGESWRGSCPGVARMGQLWTSVDSYYTHPTIRVGGSCCNTCYFQYRAGCEMLVLSGSSDEGHTIMIPPLDRSWLLVATRSNLKISESSSLGKRSPPMCWWGLRNVSVNTWCWHGSWDHLSWYLPALLGTIVCWGDLSWSSSVLVELQLEVLAQGAGSW